MSFKIAMETFNEVSVSLPPEDRMGYRDAAMEAVTGPDTGMVLDRLYKGVNARSGINFGQIPASCGDITQFAKYKTLVETMALLDRDIGDMKLDILADAHELHDNLIRLKNDFTYGFRMDNQFIKTTYNTMVYALCEMLNLCIVVYVDILKAKVDNKPYRQTMDYANLMIVQNVRRFNRMVKSGEWGQMLTEIKKNPAKLSGDSAGGLGSFMIEFVRVFGGGASAAIAVGAGTKGIVDRGKKMIIDTPNLANPILGRKMTEAGRKAAATGGNASQVMADVFKDGLKPDDIRWSDALKAVFKNIWKSVPGKVITIITAIIAAVLIVRGLICLFWKAAYSIRDMLDDQVKLLEANVQCEQNSATATEKQQKMLNMLSGLRDSIEARILKDDKNGKAEMARANNEDMRKADISATTPEATNPDDLDFG